MNVSEIHRIAELSRLKFTDAEAEAFAEQFSNIVEYVGTINSVDMAGVEPLTAVNEAVNVLRDDVVGECLTTEEALRNAPKKNDAFIKVPKVLG
ncbi:MAG TPA: Asp-tRNA(Asn)/Glu-tRNA(Gln) amidotransferase subunit GatC [Candidatus Didemnitutus sp.]|nr:Asp-tRNA(Asn)/Glu-tRNA(Gln) amidotransferase subunit GatC [Candidatus Didemnitutus sp.]